MERIVQYDTGTTFFRGLVPTVPVPQNWMLEQPVILIRGYNSAEQQFSTLEPLGLIPTRPTPQGWMQQQPNSEIFIRGFNSDHQQFSILNPVFPDVQSTLFVIELDTLLSNVNNFSPVVPIPAANIQGQNFDRMQILGFSSAQTLYYDQPETEAFYLFSRPSIVQRVSPAFARNWLLTTPNITWVYNPFGSNTTQPLSGDL